MILDFSRKGKVMVDMTGYIKKMLDEFPEVLEYASNAKAWLARMPALFTHHTHQLTCHCYVIVLQQTSLFSIFRSYDRPRAQITKVRNMLPIAQ